MGHIGLVEQLLDLGADVNAPAAAFGWVCSVSSFEAAQLSNTNRSILQDAVTKGDLVIFRLLISRGADVNALGGYHESPLGAAASIGSETMAKDLLKHGADASAGQSCA